MPNAQTTARGVLPRAHLLTAAYVVGSTNQIGGSIDSDTPKHTQLQSSAMGRCVDLFTLCFNSITAAGGVELRWPTAALPADYVVRGGGGYLN